MKNANLIGTFLLSMALAAGVTGCAHKPPMTTPIPDDTGGPPKHGSAGATNPDNGGVTSTPTPVNGEPIPLSNGDYTPLFAGARNEDADKFRTDTVYFDFDSATIKASEESKLQDLASYFKDNKKLEGLIIQGNADVRGTEKYNLSLGERRALAAREYLANLGVDPHRIKTVTFGASRPLAQGHDESAYKENRRDDFVLVTSK
jgi:outer membrane protein OmpA-like peptidoglycan-associated protein